MRLWKFVSGNALALAVGTAAVLLAAILGPSAGAGAAPTREASRSLQQKVNVILEHGASVSREPRRTTLTDDEVNSYLTFDAASQIPAGVVDPELTSLGRGRLSARAVVDLDAVRRQKPRGLLDPMNYMTGRVAVAATGTLKAADGLGRVEVEQASVGPIPVPKIVLQEVVSYYTRTAERPQGLSLDDTYALPARIREIQVETGHAVVIQ